jgi:predicted DNA-binding protein (UPF0251 family)
VGYHWRRGWRGGRPSKPRIIGKEPEVTRFMPDIPAEKFDEFGKEPVVLMVDELEALRLVDYEGMMQEEAAQQMGISRGTLWRCLDAARRKVAKMVVEGRELIVSR